MFARESTRTNYQFHKMDRARTRKLMLEFNYDKLPVRESMRAVIWRGPNAHGDDTSFGDWNSGRIRYRVLKRLIACNVGMKFDDWYSKYCRIFHGYDRKDFDRIVINEFGFDEFRFGSRIKPDYVIVEGVIVKS